ncbi:hypothetical protein [Propionibacterium australiense]|uniref:Uncharacterized protein n=1 Tax=Propionibacterium australiense TaxID=119981 RepID=A0A8B3FRR6_9ACTN|nr:hypothetical protein [Propionibacterium australiense]RLP08916.1 hypothetical protein D7U36_08900 [Propionibacterium australiense]
MSTTKPTTITLAEVGPDQVESIKEQLAELREDMANGVEPGPSELSFQVRIKELEDLLAGLDPQSIWAVDENLCPVEEVARDGIDAAKALYPGYTFGQPRTYPDEPGCAGYRYWTGELDG